MKTQTVVTDVTKDDLVNLLSAAHFGSDWLGLDYKAGNNTNQNGSFEDKLANILLEGKKIVFIDFNVDDEEDVYGNLHHHFNKSEEAMHYDVTLKDIETGILKVSKAKAVIKNADTEGCEDKYVVEYDWQTRDTAKPGIYEGWFDIDFKGDVVEAGVDYPSAGKLRVPVTEDLLIYVR